MGEVHRMLPRVIRSGIAYNEAKLKRVKELVESSSLDYYMIVSNVEAII